jgi:hypothetical protein
MELAEPRLLVLGTDRFVLSGEFQSTVGIIQLALPSKKIVLEHWPKRLHSRDTVYNGITLQNIRSGGLRLGFSHYLPAS